jgi:hypothetical protein
MIMRRPSQGQGREKCLRLAIAEAVGIIGLIVWRSHVEERPRSRDVVGASGIGEETVSVKPEIKYRELILRVQAVAVATETVARDFNPPTPRQCRGRTNTVPHRRACPSR